MQDSAIEVDLIPSQIAQLGRSQAVAEGHEEHSGIPVSVAVAAGCLYQALDLLLGQVLPRAKLSIGQAPWNCSYYAHWGDWLELRF
jgi:hypothetical protein